MKVFGVILEWWVCVTIGLSKPIDCTSSGVTPGVNYGLGVSMLCHHRCNIGNKCATLVGVLLAKDAMQVWGREHVGNLCTFHSVLLMNLKQL